MDQAWELVKAEMAGLSWNDFLRAFAEAVVKRHFAAIRDSRCLQPARTAEPEGFCYYFVKICLQAIPMFNSINPGRMIMVKGGASIVYWLMSIGFPGNLEDVTTDIDMTVIVSPDLVDYSDYQKFFHASRQTILDFVKFLQQDASFKNKQISFKWNKLPHGIRVLKLTIDRFEMDIAIMNYKPEVNQSSVFNLGIKRWFGGVDNFARFMSSYGLWVSPIEVEYCTITFLMKLPHLARNPSKMERYRQKLALIREFVRQDPCQQAQEGEDQITDSPK
jgi:hypothetical protein